MSSNSPISGEDGVDFTGIIWRVVSLTRGQSAYLVEKRGDRLEERGAVFSCSEGRTSGGKGGKSSRCREGVVKEVKYMIV